MPLATGINPIITYNINVIIVLGIIRTIRTGKPADEVTIPQMIGDLLNGPSNIWYTCRKENKWLFKTPYLRDAPKRHFLIFIEKMIELKDTYNLNDYEKIFFKMIGIENCERGNKTYEDKCKNTLLEYLKYLRCMIYTNYRLKFWKDNDFTKEMRVYERQITYLRECREYLTNLNVIEMYKFILSKLGGKLKFISYFDKIHIDYLNINMNHLDVMKCYHIMNGLNIKVLKSPKPFNMFISQTTKDITIYEQRLSFAKLLLSNGLHICSDLIDMIYEFIKIEIKEIYVTYK